MNYFHFLSKYPKPGLLRQSCHYLCVGSPRRRLSFHRPLRSFHHVKNQRYGNIKNRILSSQKNINDIHRNGRMFSNESDQQVNFDDISEEELEKLLQSDRKYQECVLEYYNIPNTGQRVFLIQPDIKWGPQKSLSSIKNQLEESVALVNTLKNWKVVGHPHPSMTTLKTVLTEIESQKIVSTKTPQKMQIFGKGNFAELTEHIRQCPAVSAIFLSIEMLTGIQWSYLQKMWNIPVYDRYTIILQIFKEHARTKEAKLQVALAEVPYIRSRLMSIHRDTTSYSQGVTQNIRHAGEIYLEKRYKLLQEQELKLKVALRKVKQQRELLRKNRIKRQFPLVAVVGYTNAGKTSIIKALTNDDDLQPLDQLFATLDVTAHSGLLPNRLKVIYMDTVGFISDIPTKLIDAFAATLEDAMIADLVIHVRDISHDDTEAQNANVHQTLSSMVSSDQLKNMIEVCNKVDLLPTGQQIETSSKNTLLTNAVNGQGIYDLKMIIQEALLSTTAWKQRKFRIFQGSPLLQWLEKEATILSAVPDSSQENLIVTVLITDVIYNKLKAKFKKTKTKTKFPRITEND